MQITPIRIPTTRRKPLWATLLPALAAGLAAAVFAFLLVRSRLPAEAAAPMSVSVVVAAHDIPARTKLTARLLRIRSVPPGDVPDGALSTPAEAVGKISVQLLPAGGAVTQSAVTVPSAALGMAFALPPSLRAVTVATDPADGVDLFVRPEDHVDILATDEPGSGPADVRTVLQNVRLLAVGTQTSPDPPSDAAPAPASSTPHVTVAVSPVQAQALVLAAARGHLHLALRAVGDGGEAPVPVFPVLTVPAPRQLSPRLHPKHVLPTVVQVKPLPPLPVALPIVLSRPPALPLPPARVTITVIKGSSSQTVSVAP